MYKRKKGSYHRWAWALNWKSVIADTPFSHLKRIVMSHYRENTFSDLLTSYTIGAVGRYVLLPHT